jgi:predicted O-methyltransferase YrrM
VDASEQAAAVLAEALIDGRVQHPDGSWRRVKANVSVQNSRALARFVKARRPALVIEIGMAYGVSTLTILEALLRVGRGRLISIDPYFGWSTARLIALHQINRAGAAHLHEHVSEPSYSALPNLLSAGIRPDLVYIDGNHGFEYALTDFFFADKLLRPGGVVAFNDAGWRSVFKVIRFLRRFRRYRELDVGLRKSYKARNPVFSILKWVEGRSTGDRYFEKLEDWEPPSGFHRAF